MSSDRGIEVARTDGSTGDFVNLDRDRIALAVQQPWAELIVRGLKTIEVRSTSVRVRGTIYIYASRRLSDLPDAAVAAERHDLNVESLPTGVIVGTANLTECRAASPDDADAACVSPAILDGRMAWCFTDSVKYIEPLQVRFSPYGIWFYPFRRRSYGESNSMKR